MGNLNWQDVIVFAIVGAAVWFLVRRIWPRQRPAETFVPLDALKRRREREDGGCH